MKFKEAEKEEKNYYFDYNDSKGRKQICGKKMHEDNKTIIVNTGNQFIKIEKPSIHEQREISKTASLGDVFGFQIKETINSTKLESPDKNYDLNKTQDLKELSGVLFEKLGLSDKDLLKIQSIMFSQGDATYAVVLIKIARSTINLSMEQAKTFVENLNRNMNKYFDYKEGPESDVCTLNNISGKELMRIYLKSLEFLSS